MAIILRLKIGGGVMKKLIVFLMLSTMSLSSDIEVVLKEGAVNKFASRVLPIVETKEVKFFGGKKKMNLSLSSFALDLKNGMAKVDGDLGLGFGGDAFTLKVKGDTYITYDKKKSALILSFKNVIVKGLDFFDVSTLLPKKVEVPISPLEDDVKINGKVIPTRIVNENLRVQEGKITISGDLEFVK